MFSWLRQLFSGMVSSSETSNDPKSNQSGTTLDEAQAKAVDAWSAEVSKKDINDPKLLELLSTHLKSLESAASTQDAASQITTSIASAERTQDTLWQFWRQVFDAASKLSHRSTQERLVQLVLAISNIKDGESEDLKWSKLPSFGSTWRTQHDTLSSRTMKSNNDDSPEINLVVNFLAFSSRLLKLSEPDRRQVDIIFAFFDIRDALEKSSPAVADCRIAAAWLQHSARVLYNTRNEGIEEMWQKGLRKKTEAWGQAGEVQGFEGETGFSTKRWMFWREIVGDRREQFPEIEAAAQAMNGVSGEN